MKTTQDLTRIERLKSVLIGPAAERILLLAGAGLLVTLITIIVVFVIATNQSKSATKSIEHDQEAIQELQNLQQLVTEYESATRGYLVNAAPVYQQKQDEIQVKLKEQIKKTNLLYKEEFDGHRNRYIALINIIENKIAFSDTLAALQHSGQRVAALDLFNKNFGFNYANKIKTLVSEIEEDETEVINFNKLVKQHAVSVIYRQLFFFIAMLLVLIALTILWINIQFDKKHRKAEEYNNILTSNITDAVISTDLEFRILSWSKAAEKIYGWTEEEAVGKLIYELLHTEYLHFTRDQVLEAVSTDGHIETEIIHTAKNGKKLNISFSKSGVTDEKGKLVRIITINKDITPFRQMELALKQSNQFLEEKVEQRTKELYKSNSLYQFISQVNQLIINTRNEQDLFQGICDIAIRDGNFKMTWIGTIDEEEFLVPVAKAGDEHGYLNVIKKITVKDVPEGRGPTGTALRNGSYYVCQDVTTDPNLSIWRDEQIKRGFHSSIALSIKKFGKVIGGFTLYAGTANYFDESVIKLLAEAVDDIGHCLEFIETEKQRAANEILLNEKEAINLAFFNTNPDGIILGSPDGQHYYGNKAACDMLGYTEQEILEVTRKELVDQEDPRFHLFLNDLFANNWARAEFNFVHKDGAKIPCEVSTSLFSTPDGKEYASVIFQDVSERMNREKLIKDYRYAIDQSSLVDVSDKNGLITYVNDNFCQLTKYSKEELIGKNQRILNSGYHPKRMFTELWRTILNGNVWRGEVRDKAKDGSIFWVQTTIVPFKDANGEIIQFLSIRNDITSRKTAEEQIKIANERYEIINQATRDTIWDKDLVNNTTIYNNGIQTMLGYNIAEIKDINSWWLENVHPEDFKQVSASLEQVLKKQEKFAVDEYRFRCADGTYKYIVDRVSIFYDANGNPIRMIGSMQDMSESKESEKRILKAIIEAQERERTQLGMELHDNIKQILAASKLNLEMALLKMDNKALVEDILTRSVTYISESIQELRRLSHQLAPTFDEAFQLHDSITNMISNMDPQKTLNVTIHVDKIKNHLDNTIQTTIFRIVQEQFNNILKHSNAKLVNIEILLINNNVHLSIKDNGKGFNPIQKKEGIGLENIRRRVQFLDGEFRLTTALGQGCLIEVVIPLNQQTVTA